MSFPEEVRVGLTVSRIPHRIDVLDNILSEIQRIQCKISRNIEMIPNPARYPPRIKSPRQPDKVLWLIKKRHELEETAVRLSRYQTDEKSAHRLYVILSTRSLIDCRFSIDVLNNIMTKYCGCFLLGTPKKMTALVRMGANHCGKCSKHRAHMIAVRAIFVPYVFGPDIGSLVVALLAQIIV
jgi:hypothetical protein